MHCHARQCMAMQSNTKLILILGLLIAPLAAQDTGAKDPEPVPIRYQVPALMMVTWAEWPEEPAQQDVMAQFMSNCETVPPIVVSNRCIYVNLISLEIDSAQNIWI